MIVKFKRGMKLWKSLVCVLMMVMLLPIGVQIHKVYAATDSGYVTVSPSVIVGNYKELVKAIDEAEDGDAIGISSNICIEGVAVLGNSEKRLTLLRMAEYGYIHVYDSGIVKFKNITFDGNSSIYDNGYIPMIQANGKVDFENVIFQNCYNQWAGGAIVVESGEVNITGCHFTNNQAGEGGHIVVHSSAHVKATDSIFENGVSTRGGGAAKIESSYEINGKIEFVACKIFENQARYGGAIANKGSVKITDSIIYGNRAETGADFLNYSGSLFEMDSIEELVGLYTTDGIRPLKWENDYVDKAYIEGDIEKENPLSAMKLIYEKVSQEADSEMENPENNTGNTDKTPNDDNSQDGQQTENNDSSTDGGNNNNSENKDDFSDNNSANGDSTENESKGDSQSEDKQGEQNQLPSDVTDSEQNKPSDSSANENDSDNNTAADLDSNTENGNTENDSKENQDKQDNQGDLANNGGSSSDSGKKDSENGNSNVSNVPVESGNQIDNPNIDKPNTGNEGSASELKPEENKQHGGTVNNENQGGTLAGNASNNQNQSNNIVADNGNNTVNKYPSDNINGGSGSSTGNGNASNNTFQSEGNVSIQPEDSNDSGSSDKEGTAAITNNSQTTASDSNNGNSSKEPTVMKKKVIKKLTITANKRKITGKTVKKAIVKVKIGKKTYKVKSNAKGKFVIELKGKTKLKKGQKIKITISKTGYKTKHKTYKVK